MTRKIVLAFGVWFLVFFLVCIVVDECVAWVWMDKYRLLESYRIKWEVLQVLQVLRLMLWDVLLAGLLVWLAWVIGVKRAGLVWVVEKLMWVLMIVWLWRVVFHAKSSVVFVALFLFVIFVVRFFRDETRNLFDTFWWLIYDFFGIRLIISKIFPAKIESKTKPVSFFLWFVGIYMALFGIASQRYENKLDSLETKINVIYSQLGNPDKEEKRSAFAKMSTVQNIKIPIKPELFYPESIVYSLFLNQKNNDIVNDFKTTIEAFKSQLSGIYLSKINLSYANLEKANLQGAHLWEADLRRANLARANLRDAFFRNAKFQEADLTEANLQGADLGGANLAKANLRGANLRGAKLGDYGETCFGGAGFREADLRGADLEGADLQRANLQGADLEGAEFQGARCKNAFFLIISSNEREQIYSSLKTEKNVVFRKILMFFGNCRNTRFPEGFDPKKRKMINLYDYYKKHKTLPDIVLQKMQIL